MQNASQLSMTPGDLFDFLCSTIPAKLPILIKGAPGVGKTDVGFKATAYCGADMLLTHPVVKSPTDYTGLPWMVDGKADFIPYADLMRLIEADRPTVCFMDDLGQAPASVQAACMQLLLAREINGHKVSDHVCFIAATNRKSDRAGVSGILEPVKSRFATIVELVPDVDDWIRWALDADMPISLIAFIKFRPELLWKFEATSDITNSPCPRTVANVGKLMKLGLPRSVEYKAYAGAAGEGFAGELLAFLEIERQLPHPDLVLSDPEHAEVPTAPNVNCALAAALASRASVQTADRLFCYANRMEDEYSVLLKTLAVRRDPEIIRTRAFMDWASKHSHVEVG